MRLTKLDMLISSIYFLIIIILFATDNFSFKIFIITTLIYFAISFTFSLIQGEKDYN